MLQILAKISDCAVNHFNSLLIILYLELKHDILSFRSLTARVLFRVVNFQKCVTNACRHLSLLDCITFSLVRSMVGKSSPHNV